MADLEDGVQAETLIELGAQAGESLVGEEDVALHLLGDLFNGARVAEAERRSSVLEGPVCVEYDIEDGVGRRRRRLAGDFEGG